MVGFISSSHFIDHDTGPSHPERPDRIRAIATAVRLAGLIDSPNPFPNFHLDFGPFDRLTTGRFDKLTTGPFDKLTIAPFDKPTTGKLLELPEPKPADEKWLRLVHPPGHIQRVRHICQLGGGVLDQGDTPVSERSFEIALMGVGALLQACDAVMAGTVNCAFAAVRPPGHHAEVDRAMGFCLFANISIAARYLQQHHGIGKVAIVDFDVHHGNGTQAVFDADPSVLFISLHQDPRTCYPGSGYDWETGTGPATGTKLNLPMPPGSTDAEYIAAFHERVLPALDVFKPEALLISAGFDAHRDDPLAQVNLSEECFGEMTRLLVQAAKTHSQGRIISVLEGGYNLRALGRSVVRHLVALAG